MPDLIRTQLANYLARLRKAGAVHVLAMAQERAKGFVDGVEASLALPSATVKVLFIAIEEVGVDRHRALATRSRRQSSLPP
ncbi:hypothetical protein ICY20_27325 [Pseudomonas sp. P115]|uniref:hypothetical protein n=1 Tax=Pseudomonas pisciculturae TaxID=2730413 RepID=UPI00189236DC|nr:hypothetical protein [Pseudomonas pisciculturae]MBF6031475.1 hypothetical protein [Pseudomonas pisciculturae]